MTSGTDTFNPQEFCSRKLWDMVSAENADTSDTELLDAAVAELEERRSYLAELQLLGKSSKES
jgi:hypothetical protein